MKTERTSKQAGEDLSASESPFSLSSKGQSHRMQPGSLTSFQMGGAQRGHQGTGMRKLAEETGSGLGKAPGRSDTIQSRNVFNWGSEWARGLGVCVEDNPGKETIKCHSHGPRPEPRETGGPRWQHEGLESLGQPHDALRAAQCLICQAQTPGTGQAGA